MEPPGAQGRGSVAGLLEQVTENDLQLRHERRVRLRLSSVCEDGRQTLGGVYGTTNG